MLSDGPLPFELLCAICGRSPSAHPSSSLPAPTMAAAAPAPQYSNVLASLDPQTLKLIIQALPIAQELHLADVQRFAPRRHELLQLYGDEAAPNLLDPELLRCAKSARDERLVDESFMLALIDKIAAAKAARLPLRTDAPMPLHENAVRTHRQELRASLELPTEDQRSAFAQPKAESGHWSTTLDDISLPVATTKDLQTAVAALTMLIAELEHSYKLKLGDSLRPGELVAIMAMLEVSFVGASPGSRLSAMRWLEFRAADMGWPVSLMTLEDSQTRAESRSMGLDGYGYHAVANLRDFRSPVELVAYKAFAGYGVAPARTLQALRVPCCALLRTCISLALSSERSGCQ